LNKNVGSTKMDKLNSIEDKRKLPVFVKYGLVAVAIIAVIVAGILIFLNVAGGYVATVDGKKIKTGEYKYYLEGQKESMLNIAKESDPNMTMETFLSTNIGGVKAIKVIKQKALDTARDTKMMYMKAKEAKVSLTADQLKSIDDGIQSQIIDQVDPQNNQAAGTGNKIRASKKLFDEYGFTIDDLRNAQIENYTAQMYQSSEMNKIKDADASVDSYYKSNPEWFKEDTQLRKGAEEAVWARHILISFAEDATQEVKDAAKKKAEDLIAQLKAGADFATLVKDNSDDPGSKDQGGQYVFGKGQMYPDFEKAAFGLNPGQITETPVLSTSGYHIIKLEEKIAKDQPVSLKCAKEYNEYGTAFVKYKLFMIKVAEWDKDPKYKAIPNTAVYDSIE
jgi:parvulin-like peptidyl-prolyl isomerase